MTRADVIVRIPGARELPALLLPTTPATVHSVVKWEGPDLDAIWSNPRLLGNSFCLLLPTSSSAILKRSLTGGNLELKCPSSNRGLKVLGASATRTETVGINERITVQATGIIAVLIGV